MAGPAKGSGPLAGVRVTDFTWAWAGPHGTLLLAMLGAEVIKIESRTRLDHSRMRSLMSGAVQGGPDHSPLFNDLNLNKLSLTLNLRKPEAREVVKRLVAQSDVVTQNMRPGVLARLGIGYEQLSAVKPDIIMLSSSAVGATGPEATYSGYAPTFASLGGAAALTGYPEGTPFPLSGSVDLRVGTTAAFAVLAALYHRNRTGEGQNIDLSSTEVMTAMMGEAFVGYSMTGRMPERMGNRHPSLAPHNCYRAAGEQQWVTIAVGSDPEWRALCRVIDDPALEDEGFAEERRRWENQDRLDAVIERWTRVREPDAIVEALQRAGVASLRVRAGADIADDPQVRALGTMETVEHPLIGKRLVVGAPWTFEGNGVGIRSPAPLIGQHTGYVLGEILGLCEAEIAELRDDGVLE